MSIRAVVFDFGGVFIDSPFAAVADAAARQGLDPQRLNDVVFGSYDQDTDHPWHQLERGEISVIEARDRIIAGSVADGGAEIDPFVVLADLAGGEIRSDMVEFCVEVRALGLKTGLLTNNAREFETFWREILPLDELFDDVVDSSAVGMRKPDPRIYRLSLERLGGVAPADAVFIDDAIGNVNGARAVGMAAVHIGHQRSDVPTALAELRSLIR